MTQTYEVIFQVHPIEKKNFENVLLEFLIITALVYDGL